MKFLAILLVCSILLQSSFSSKRSHTMSFSKYNNRYRWPISHLHTNNNDWGNQATIFLDRHEPDCKIGAISQFRLIRPTPSTIRYDIVCLMPLNCKKKCPAAIRKIDQRYCSNHKTNKNDLGNWGGMSTNYLDRHDVQCPHGKVLTKFGLKTDWQHLKS